MRLVGLLLTMGLAAAAQPVADLTGARVDPLHPPPGKFSALFFVTTDCPISNYYAAAIRRICTTNGDRLQCYLIYTDPGLTQTEIARHRAAYGHGEYPAIFDSEHRLVKALGATVTPEAALVDSKGQAIYQGRIDNSYESLGKRRAVVTEHELTGALAAALAGKPIPVARTKATGCFITPVELLKQLR